MLQAATKKVNLLLIYQCVLAIGAVLVFFTNVDQFSFMAGMSPAPTYVILAFCVAAIPILLFSLGKLIYFSHLVILWAVCFLTLSMFSFALSPFSELAREEINRRVLAIIFILLMLILFSGSHLVQLWARRAVFITVIINIINIVLELFNPLLFAVIDFSDRPPDAVRYADRPAGLYIDPNKAAFALTLGMVFCTTLLPQKYRVPFVLLIGLAIFLTFSRGAVLCWLILLVIFSLTGVISKQKILYWIIGLVVLALVLSFSGGFDLSQLRHSGLLTDDMMGRLEWFQDPFAKEGSADSRKEVAALAFRMFLEHPILGNGIGSTRALSVGISTHNMYLYYMADHGILGALLVPGLIFTTVWNVCGNRKFFGISFLILVSSWCLFSHTVLEDRFILTSFALMAAMTATSQQEQQMYLVKQRS
ncbi:O-antigen ligase family protein [Myxacorys almedinensis]|uniref:O-antigen ligase-related domain-containing protein n=1 Tax=Myxacorys almedinensis A TaxID=2690445 RepID=A0A8J8CMZ6_9CYAN|nr:O-antigen ligase family protein [Myxacorys almedinensis]NDJ17882.1 hypothetical protein [Myxacorys almedinensis A]